MIKLNEGKQVGTIYHFTTLQKLIRILNAKQLQCFGFSGGISFTRNKDLWYESSDIRMVFNGTKIADNYKISPYLYWGTNIEFPTSDLRIENPKTIDIDKIRSVYGDEAEEKVYARSIPLLPYLISIDILLSTVEDEGDIIIEIMQKYVEYKYNIVLSKYRVENLTLDKAHKIYYEDEILL